MPNTLLPGDTLRILLVAEQESLRNEFAALLKSYAGEHVLYWVAQTDLASRRAMEVLPQVALLDDALGAAAMTRAVKSIIANVPGTAVLVVVDANGLGSARQAVLSGARGFIPKPLVAEDAWATIRQVLTTPAHIVHDQEQTRRTGRVIVFVGPKGGTGRTMIATNTALGLRKEAGCTVVMIDADFAAPALDVVLNVHEDRDLTHLLTRAAGLDPELINGVLAHHSSGLRVLLAPPPGQVTDISLPKVQQIIGTLRDMFAWVVVDLGLPMDETAFAFIDSADRIIMTVLPEMVGLRNTRLMIDQLQARGHSEAKIWLVLNRSTIPSGVSREDIERRLRVRVHTTVPDDQGLVSQSVNRGVPLMVNQERSAVCRAIQTISHELLVERMQTRRESDYMAPAVVRANPFARWLRHSNEAEL
jgi:pilus assembly protein CpaE